MSVFILDASVATRMFLATPERAQALAAARAHEFIAPRLILTETSNALWKYVRRGDIALNQAQEAVRQLDRQLSIVDDFRLTVLALRLASELDHPVYDCVYLATAQTYQYPLLTADKRLSALARDLSLDVVDLASIPLEG
ncbi:type II toxin-antitoxin system VapC family toxin [Maricaulis sp.]|uniref:type II toxin-antitoxin system VapC family toxin n=1 Tax=Maricaulis sp. TaxID=1486257 RepID=UPI003A910C61